MAFVSTTPSARQRVQQRTTQNPTMSGSQNQNYNPGSQQAYTGSTSQQYNPTGDQGPFGQGKDSSQQQYNSNWYSTFNAANPYTSGYDKAVSGMQDRNWGSWNDEKQQAANVAYASSYGVPMIQAQQAARNAAFGEASWAANFAEQQYLNKNSTALDWAANQREDAGLNYAMTSGDRQFLADQAQQGISNEQAMYNLQTQRASQESQSKYQTGQLSNDRTKIGNDYAVAQQQNQIDSDYKKGLIGVEQYNARTNELKAQNDFKLGSQANDNTRYATDITKLLGLGDQANDKYGIDVQRELGMAQNDTQREKILKDYAIAQQQNNIDEAYKNGLLSNEEYKNKTDRLRAENDMTLGQGQLDLGYANIDSQNYATDKEYDIGLRNAETGQYGAQTGRMQVQNQHQIAQGQLLLDTMVRNGQLTNDQYQAQTARLQQQSQESQWQQQLAAQQGNFGQQLSFDRERMQAELLQSRYNAGGRASNPNYSAWNQSWF